MTTTVTHTRGASFDIAAVIPDTYPDGTFDGHTVTAQVRTATSETLVADLQTAWADPATTRVLRLTADDTTTWPVDHLYFDVRFSSPAGKVLYSPRTLITVTRQVTRA